MKLFCYFFVLLLVPALVSAQNDIGRKYHQADSLLQAHNAAQAYVNFKELKSQVGRKDTLFEYVVWHCVSAAIMLASDSKSKENFAGSLKYELEALNLIQENKNYFGKRFAEREYWTTKNIIVSYFGLGQLERADDYKKLLYKAYIDKTLPEGLNTHFNFDFFKINGVNVWGYEWYPELPEDRFSSSFTKVVYYVYSTNADGSDKDQLYCLHLLMFHKTDESARDYVLTKIYDTEGAEVAGTYYKFFYSKNINYKKLKSDVLNIVSADLQPDTKRVRPIK